MDDAQLRTIWQQRQFRDSAAHLSQPLSWFMKHTLAKRARQLGQLAEVWDELIPQPIRDHTALDKFHRGVLTVIVDSAAHRFQLQTLLMGGLLRELQRRFSGALDKVRVVPGRFYSVDVSGARRYEF
jgi:hypothetical protein